MTQQGQENDQAAFWNRRYSDERYIFGKKPNVFLTQHAHLLRPGMRALVPGDGEGRNGVWLAKQGLIVDSVDVAEKGIEKARKLAAEAGVSPNFILADLRDWDWPREAYEIVAALYVQFSDADRPAMHRAMMDALKPGGILLIEAFSLRQLDLQKAHHSGGPREASMLFSAEKLRADFASRRMLHLEELEIDLDEGHRHSGRAAVVRCVVEMEG